MNILTLVVALAAFSSSTFVSRGDPSVDEATVEPSIALEPLASSISLEPLVRSAMFDCYEHCEECVPGAALWGSFPGLGGGEAVTSEMCHWGESCDNYCDGDASLDAADQGHIWETTVGGDPAALKGLLAEYPENLTVNGERQSLLVSGCGGRLVASIPLTDAQLQVTQEE
jgi:hypothetical protein